jgi:hypothetical protein
MVIAGIIGILVIAAGIYFVGLPLISGSNGTVSNLQQSTILSSPTLTQLPITISTKTTSTPTSAHATTEQTTALSTPTQTYKNADLTLSLNTRPVYGFSMDYPSDWTYKREHTKTFTTGYNFSSPDERSFVFVGMSNGAGSGDYFYPLYDGSETALDKTSWENNIIKGMTVSAYCNDGRGIPASCVSSLPSSAYYYMRLLNKETIILAGDVKARKIVFAPDIRDVSTYWWETDYIMQVGEMQGYNFTVPGHFEVAKTVSGDVWDYGMGGTAYLISIVTPSKKESGSPIYDHMIKSFEVT